MQSLLAWLTALPLPVLFTVLLFTSALENLVPPFPSDLVVAFGGFLVAQTGRGSLLGVFLAVWIGNVGGAMIVYALGRKYGAERLERRLAGRNAQSRDARLHAMFDRYGLPAIFVSRFVPGVRALVPAVAGAARLPVLWTTVMIGLASAVWYGLIVVIAFRAGSDWERLRASIARVGTTAAIIGSVVLAAGILIWVIARRKRTS